MVRAISSARRLALAACTLLAAVSCGGGGGGGIGGGDGFGPRAETKAPGGESQRFSVTTLTGFVFDGKSGKPLPNATVTTTPSTETTRTNQSGFFALGVGHSFGVMTVSATADGYTQRQTVCVNLKPGLNTIADISLVEAGADSGDECLPACSDANVCLSGVCVSACNPLCSCAERCVAGGACEADPDAVPAAICGSNAHPLGVGACECDLGFIAAGDGQSCVRPAEVGQCPENSTPTDTGCECDPYYLPDPVRDACVPQDELVAPDALTGSDDIVAEWPAPGPAPRGIAFDGQHLWVGDAATRRVYQLGRTGVPTGRSHALGPMGRFLKDITEADGVLYLQFTRTEHETAPALYRMDPASGTLTKLEGAFGMDVVDGLTFDGESLSSLEDSGGQQVVKRRSLEFGSNTFQTTVSLDPERVGSGRYFVRPKPTQFLAYTQNQYVSWAGTRFDGSRFLVEFATLNAVHRTTSEELGSFTFALGGSHVVGLEAYGSSLWVALAGTGEDVPKVVEVVLE